MHIKIHRVWRSSKICREWRSISSASAPVTDESDATSGSLPRASVIGAGPSARKGSAMGQPVVHFEVIGKDPAGLRGYYRELFGWERSEERRVGNEGACGGW